jgi:hypothetical protein
MCRRESHEQNLRAATRSLHRREMNCLNNQNKLIGGPRVPGRNAALSGLKFSPQDLEKGTQ